MSNHDAFYHRERRRLRRDRLFDRMVEQFPYIMAVEPLAPKVAADPPACFTPTEWASYAESVSHFGHYAPRLGVINYSRPGEEPTETDKRGRRQKAALMFAACEDCTLAYQLGQVLVNRCHPPTNASTPARRLAQADQKEDTHVAPDTGPDSPEVLLLKEVVPD